MQDYFNELSNRIFSQLHGTEVLLLNYHGEESDFSRFNKAKIRQAGHVAQKELHLDFIDQQKQCHAEIQLSGEMENDLAMALQYLDTLRGQMNALPQDPFINYAQQQKDSSRISSDSLPVLDEVIEKILQQVGDLDLVGIWASGSQSRGFANSLGQRNWHTDFTFNFDWSIYHQGDKAIKQNYAGNHWNDDFFEQKIQYARQTLPLLGKSAKIVEPGKYRVFLAPAALHEIMSLLNWGGFGLKSHRTQQTPLIKMIKDGVTLNPQVSLVENHAKGVAPRFSEKGFNLPNSVDLIKEGRYVDALVGARSAMEYQQQVNCDVESARSLEILGGDLHQDDVLKELGRGIYISNLWYCNYSDRNHCRVTGMTRFACLWVENGEPVAPLGVMRFDESVLDLLGPKLVALTQEREHILDPASYEKRSYASAILPGVLVDDFTFTL